MPGLTILWTCPSALIVKALVSFDSLTCDALSNLTGGPLPDWSRLKTSLPSFLGGLNVRQASPHAPAYYFISFLQCRSLISQIFGHTAAQPVHLTEVIGSLALAAARPDWCGYPLRIGYRCAIHSALPVTCH